MNPSEAQGFFIMKLRRRTRWCLYGSAAVLLVFVLAHTSPARQIVRRLVVGAIPGLGIEELRYQLWRGSIELRGIRFESAGQRVSADRVRARISPRLKVTADVDALEVDLDLQPPDSPHEFGDYDGAYLTFLRELRVTNGVVRAGDWLRMGALELSVLEDGNGYQLEARSAQGLFRDVSFGPSDASIHLGDGQLRVESVRFEKENSDVEASGSMSLGETRKARFTAEFTLDASLARQLHPDLLMSGELYGTLTLALAEESETAELDLRSDRLTWLGIAVQDLVGRTTFSRDTLIVDRLEAQGLGGRLRLDGRAELAENGRQRFALDWSGVELGEVMDGLGRTPLPFGANLDGRADITMIGWDRDTATGTAELRLAPLGDRSLTGDVRLELAGGILDATYRARMDHLDEWGKELPLEPRGSVVVEGRWQDILGEPLFSAELESRALLIEDKPLVLSGSLSGSAEHVQIEALSITGDAGHISLEGTIPISPARRWDLAVAADSLELPRASGVEGVVHARVELAGAAEQPEWSAEVKLASLIPADEARFFSSGRYHRPTRTLRSDFQLRSLSLGAISSLAERVEGLTASVDLDAKLEGPLLRPTGTLDARINDLNWRKAPMGSLDVQLESDGDSLKLTAKRDGAPIAEGKMPLEPPYPAELSVELGLLPLPALVRAFTGLELSQEELVTRGKLTAELDFVAVETLRYRAQVDQLSGKVRGIPFRSAPFSIEGRPDALRIHELRLVGEHELAIDGVVPIASNSSFELTLEGASRLTGLELLVPNLEIEAAARLNLAVSGTRDAPVVDGELTITNGSGSWSEVQWSDLDLSVRIAPNDVALDATARLLNGTLRATGDSEGVDFELCNLDVRQLLPDSDVPLSAVVSLTGAIDIESLPADAEDIRVSGAIERAALGIGDATLSLVAAAPWTLERSVLSVRELRIEGPETSAVVRVKSATLMPEPKLDVAFSGTLNHALFTPLLGESAGMTLRGSTFLEGRANYSDGALVLDGEGNIQGGGIDIREPRVTLSDLEARIRLSEAAIHLADLHGRAGSGELNGEGRVDFGESTTPDVDLRMTVDDVPIELVDGLRADVSGELRLENDDAEVRLTGDLQIERGLLTRELDTDDTSFSAQSFLLRDPTEADSVLDRTSLDVALRTRSDIRVENSLARLDAGGSLSLRGTIRTPELRGIINLKKDGTFNLGRNAFRILQGRVEMAEYPLVPVRIEIEATTQVGSVSIQLDVEGEVDDLRTSLSAPDDPELTEGDLASLIVTGRTLEAASEGGAELASTWAVSSLANLLHEGLGNVIFVGPPPGAGPLVLAEEADPTSRLTVGFPVTENLSWTYSMALDDSERRLTILDYRVARNLWLRGIQENSNDYTVGLSHRFEVDFPGRKRRSGTPVRQVRSVASVAIRGDESLLNGDIRKTLQFRQGERYDYWEARDAAERVERKLIEDGYLGAVVDVDAQPLENPETVALSFSIEAGRRIQLEFLGDDPGKGIKEAIEKRWDGRTPEELLVADLAARAAWMLRADRHYSAEVKPELTENGAIFRVSRGARGRDVVVSFDGNEALDDQDLVAALPDPSEPEFFALLDRPEELARGVRLRYAFEGYLNVQVGEPVASFDEAERKLYVSVPIAEGLLSRIAGIHFEGADSIAESRLREAVSLSENEPVNFPEIRKYESALRMLYREEGFPNVRLRAELSRVEAGVDVTIRVQEGARARVGRIRIAGNLSTRASVIRRQLTFREGDPVRPTDFLESQKRLYDIGIFRSADIRLDPAAQGKEIQDVLIRVVERSDLEVSYGARFNSVGEEQLEPESEGKSDGLGVFSRVSFVNPFGRGANVGLAVSWQDDHKLYRGSLLMPTVFGRRLPTELILESEFTRFENVQFDSERWGFTFQQTKRLTAAREEKFALQWNFLMGRYRGVGLQEDGASFGIDIFRARFGLSIIEDRRDSFGNPTRGRFWNVTYQLAPKALGSDLGYHLLYGQLFTYYPIRGRVVWASSYRMGVAGGSKEFLLIDDRFRAGGGNSVRGFAQNSLGPSFVPSGRDARVFVGGQAVAVFNQELRFPVYKALHGGVFWDAGNVFTGVSDYSLRDLRHSAGAGVRFVLPFGALRLDWARILDPKEGEQRSRWHFGFGYAF